MGPPESVLALLNPYWPSWIRIGPPESVLALLKCIDGEFSIQYIVYNIQYTVYNIQYTVYSIQYTVYSIQYTVYSIHCDHANMPAGPRQTILYACSAPHSSINFLASTGCIRAVEKCGQSVVFRPNWGDSGYFFSCKLIYLHI